jgi:hypothetical protein
MPDLLISDDNIELVFDIEKRWSPMLLLEP